MSSTKNEILSRLKSKLESLKNIKLDEHPFLIKKKVEGLILEVQNLSNDSTYIDEGKGIYRTVFKLNHTLNKELVSLESTYSKLNRGKKTKSNIEEYIKMLRKFEERIFTDLLEINFD